MHYQLSDNGIVKSENAALTVKQPNQNIINYISSLETNIIALDYGCGKLRHTIHLYPKCSFLVAVDSEIQLNRTQIVNEEKTNVSNYIKSNMPNAIAVPLTNGNWIDIKYDFVLCTNVLSAIPSYDEREKVFSNIKYCLAPTGKALISVQYRNSYFKSYTNNENAKPYLDGWIIKKGTSYSFYGIINPNDLINLSIVHGLKPMSKKLIDGSIYLEVCHSDT